ncbi:uncharacterized protein Z520_00009 [Fonsecaea multimorphosa CBS 102226]|uniref:Uncharacterized protein n=1 Tax=Fonsecaea multimorphosa CBS 102226 TaxID=1442371 RepID=A0A0D2KBA7_9EURO|nr:uncharacterized protein Z520_00009 [Fonsecaea multimorphosa CBS 102226]KIY03318.1 hypothetical protein Z520_00009 [Fonsecaea multimorphosa CBS 102226]OAL32969.1 hypothetical protein AYO22_00054 [Fonsecaea multimorphosa]
MTFFSSNRFLLTVLVVGLGTACFAVPILLGRVKDAARAPPPDPPPPAKRLQKDSENSLKLETLRTLADGYSYDLRTSAIKIVASRTVRTRTRDLLLHDLASEDDGRRENAINALHMLLTHSALNETVCNHFRDPKAIKAIVHGLINVLPQHEINVDLEAGNNDQSHVSAGGKKSPPPSPIRPAHRPAQEAQLLDIFTIVVHGLSRRDIKYPPVMDAALDAGLVTKWLANYPFPCALPENSEFNFKRDDVARLFDRMAWLSDDPVMGDVILVVMQYARARRQMREVGLSASSYKENMSTGTGRSDSQAWNQGWGYAGQWQDEDEDADEDNDVRMVNGEDTAGLLVPGNPAVASQDNITLWDDEPTARSANTTRAATRLRSAERSQEEEHLRRRHREAIVVAERGTPLSRENILQRANSEILQPMNGVSEVEGELNGLLNLSETSTEPQQEEEASDLPTAADTADIVERDSPSEDQVLKEEQETMVEDTAEEDEDGDEEEMNRAQRRHREIEQLIEEDPEIQGTSEMRSRPDDSSAEVVEDVIPATTAISMVDDDGGAEEQEDSS